MHPALRTRATELFGVRYPVVQTGMGWVSGPRLTSATANAGGLGILASATLSYEELQGAIAETKARTTEPFGVNLRADAPDAARRIDLLAREGVRVASFALAPKQELIARCKDAGMVVVPSIGARRHAEKVAAWGADAVIVQGGEGGGHTGAVPTTVLLPQVVDAVDIPVIAAGGFFDGRGLVAALAYGAEGIAMGTRFLLTSDSAVSDDVKQVYLSAGVDGTVVSRQVDGVPHRVLRTDLVEALESGSPPRALARSVRAALAYRRLSGTPLPDMVREGLAMKRSSELSWTQVLMAANTPVLLKSAMVDGRPDLGVMASGQVVGLIDDLPSCAELVGRVVGEATAVLTRLASPASASWHTAGAGPVGRPDGGEPGA
ncbi:MAG TPA: nitronate monooxygenase [Mycobacteriales bacterium]|nr:nitronate monooxygenase [Mycobacteriales bacterium]